MADDNERGYRAVIAGLAWVSIAQYFVVEELVVRGWLLPYRRSTNYVSDLGATICGPYEGREICSPDHVRMNLSFALVGLAVVVGAVLLRAVTTELVTWPVLASYLAGGLGSALVGLFPVDTGGSVHQIGAGLFFVGASLGHVLLGERLRREGNPYGMALTLIGAVGLIATVLVVAGVDLGLGAGSVERVVVYGANLGFIATGALMIWVLDRRLSATGRIPVR